MNAKSAIHIIVERTRLGNSLHRKNGANSNRISVFRLGVRVASGKPDRISQEIPQRMNLLMTAQKLNA
jgi:hypothetical protein